jgi:hypothetical protein
VNSTKLVIGVIVRHGLGVLFAILVAHGYIDQKSADASIGELMIGLTGIGGVVCASLWQKAVAKWKFLAALQSAPSTRPEAIADRAADATITEKVAALTSPKASG